MTKKILKIVIICLCCAFVIALSVVMVKKTVNDNRLKKYGHMNVTIITLFL